MRINQEVLVIFLLISIVVSGGFLFQTTASAQNTTSSTSVSVGNSTPVVSGVTISSTTIVLIANATKTITVSFSVSDSNGCNDVFTSGNVTTTLYRTSLGNSCTADNLNCYRVTTTTNNCTNQTSANATSTFELWYIAQATDASSSFPTDSWRATAEAKDGAAATHSANSGTSTVQTLTAINISPTSINYGTVSAGTNTGALNQTTTVANAGNSSSTLTVNGSTQLTSGGNVIDYSNQKFGTTSVTYASLPQSLATSAAAVSGFRLNPNINLTPTSGPVYWGLAVPGGQPQGSYTGVNLFSAVYSAN